MRPPIDELDGLRGALDPHDALDALLALDVGVVCVASDWRVTFANAAWRATSGATGDPVGEPLWAVLPGLVGGAAEEALREALRDGRPRAVRVEHHGGRAADRAPTTLDVRVIRTPSRTLVLTVRDASAERRLERDHERLLESVGEGLVVVDAAWRVTHFNAAAERIAGVRRDAVLGQTLWEAFPGIVGTAVERTLREAMESREWRAAAGIALAREPGGRPAGLFDVRSYPVDGRGGERGGGGVLALFTDVSDRERQSRALAERSAENERLRELARAMAAEADSAALLRILCEAAVAHAGGDAATVAEVDADEGVVVAAVGHPPAIVGHRFPLADTLTREVIDACRAGRPAERVTSGAAALGRPAPDPALVAELGDGRRVGPVLLAPLAAHGEVLGVIAVSRVDGARAFADRDARRVRVVADHAALALWKARLIEEAHAASETRSSFVATVSHELRTPLTALTGYGELLADEILGPLTPGQHDVMDRMRAVTHQLTAMIEEILTFSSLEAGGELVRPRPMRAEEPVEATVAVIAPLAAQRGLAFSHEIAPDVPPFVADPDKVRQILVNLAANAVKFTERGEVRLAVRRDGDRAVRFAVTDTGPGIARDDLKRLFQPFTQLHTGLTRRHGGTGLGLYISRRLAELLGARVEVDSTPGAGSTFTLVVPLAPRGEG